MFPDSKGISMRCLAAAVAALVLSACGQTSDDTATAPGCARTAVQQVTWSSADAPDSITATSDGPTCAQAVVTLVVRNAGGDPLWAFASTYYDMTSGGAPPPGAAPATEVEVDRFLGGWARVTEMRSSGLPQWREDAATLTESAETFAYETPFERETYESLRAQDLPMICYAAAAEASQCLIIDPLSNTPAMIVAYGP
jgi:hypothetical protein